MLFYLFDEHMFSEGCSGRMKTVVPEPVTECHWLNACDIEDRMQSELASWRTGTPSPREQEELERHKEQKTWAATLFNLHLVVQRQRMDQQDGGARGHARPHDAAGHLQICTGHTPACWPAGSMLQRTARHGFSCGRRIAVERCNAAGELSQANRGSVMRWRRGRAQTPPDKLTDLTGSSGKGGAHSGGPAVKQWA